MPVFFLALLGDGRIIFTASGGKPLRSVPIYRDTTFRGECLQRASLSDKVRQRRTNRGGGRAPVAVDQIILMLQWRYSVSEIDNISTLIDKIEKEVVGCASRGGQVGR